METTYQILKRIENTASFLTLLKRGLVPVTIFEKKVYYEYYLRDFEMTGSSGQSVFNTSEEYDKSERTIWRAIKFMEN